MLPVEFKRWTTSLQFQQCVCSVDKEERDQLWQLGLVERTKRARPHSVSFAESPSVLLLVLSYRTQKKLTSRCGIASVGTFDSERDRDGDGCAVALPIDTATVANMVKSYL